MRRFPLLLLSAFSCAVAVAAEPVRVESPFDLNAVKFIREAGTASVTGTAALALKDGSVKDCAGFNIELLPVAGYSNERIFKTYRNNSRGQVLLEDNPPKFTPDVKEYHDYVLKAVCDARGEFKFEQVPAGDYYVMAFIIWDVTVDGAARKTGGGVMHRIHVEPGAHVRAVLAVPARGS
jgi:hypothetical protein